MKFVTELLVSLENFGGFLVEELKKVFAAGSREEKARHWIQVGKSIMKEKLVLLENFRGFLVEELEQEFPAGSREEKARHWIQVGKSIMKEKLVLLENFRGFLLEKVKVFKADSGREKVRQWIQVGKPFLIYGLAIFLLYRCLRFCCRYCCGRRGVVKTMKAPGRAGRRIPRAGFEKDPSGYFRALHADRR